MAHLRLLFLGGVCTALAGCGLGSLGGSAPPPPPPVVARPTVPTVEIAAAPQVVRDVLVARARSRGAAPTLTRDAVVLQRVLPSTNEDLAAQCGAHMPGRMVRVVLGTQPIATGTRVVEQRYVVDGANVCALKLSELEVNQAEASLNEVKVQAEQRVARR